MMDKRRVIKITILIIGVIFIATLLELGIRFIASSINENIENKVLQEQEEKIYNSYGETVKRNIELFLEDILDAINNKDYTHVFTCLESTYKKYMFDDDIEKMKAYIEKELSGLTNYEIIKISSKAFIHNVIVGISSEDGYATKTFTIKAIDEENFSIMFGEFNSIKEENLKYSLEKFDFNVNYAYSVSEFLVYVLDISNKTKETADFKFNSISMIYSSGNLKNGKVPDEFKLGGGETKRVELVFSKTMITESILNLDLNINDVSQIIKMIFENI